MTMMKGLLAAAVSLACLTAAGSAHAAVTISFDQIGGDVVATTTGTFDRTLTTRRGTFYTGRSSVYAEAGVFVSGQAGATGLFGITGVSSIGTGSTSYAFKTSGTAISLSQSFFSISDDYASNSQILSTAVFTGTTIAALGLTPASYSYAVGSNAVTLNIGQAVAAVPEPATWAMMLVGFGMVGATARYRCRKIATVYA